MQKTEQLNDKLEANVIKCQSWVLSKLNALPVSRKEGSYKRKDGSITKTLDIAFSNGVTFQVSSGRFWKKK